MPRVKGASPFAEFGYDRDGVFLWDIEEHDGFIVDFRIIFRSRAGLSPVLDGFGVGIGLCFESALFHCGQVSMCEPAFCGLPFIIEGNVVRVLFAEPVAPKNRRLAKPAPADVFLFSTHFLISRRIVSNLR